jgi:D-cysteine desulfhydrase
MDLELPVRATLARLPTPLERLDRAGRELGIELWVKRDDLTGLELSGNKVRKLEFLAALALERGADTLVTCGAVGSNHARATAVTAARLGMSSHLLLRGEPADPPDGNLLLDLLVGAGITFIPRSRWPERDRLMEGIAEDLRRQGRSPFVIPEGGSNAVGALGYALAVRELLEQARAEDLRIARIVHATGSGGTTAGLALGAAACGADDLDVVGVAVCDDAAYFDGKIRSILDQAAATGFTTPEVAARCRWRILEGWKGTGYAETTPEEMRDLAHLARTEGILLDPVYTGKAFRGLAGEARAGRLPGVTVFLHTGGLFGLFAYAKEIRALTTTSAASAPRGR